MSESLELWQALGVCPGDVVAFTGGGGKTSLALRLVRELQVAGRGVIFTCTTRMFPVPWMEQVLTATSGDGWLEAVGSALSAGRPVCLGDRIEPESGKLTGIPAEHVAALKRFGNCVVLVEADGSAGLPLKAPAPHEPVIPPAADIVVPVAGAAALGRPLDSAHVHRASLAARLAGVTEGAPVTPAVVADALLAPDGCTRGTPAGARIVPVLGQADTPGAEALLRETARLLVGRSPAAGWTGAPGAGDASPAPQVGRVVIAAPATAQPVRGVYGDVAAVVLAGGASRRFGGSKLLHRLDDRTILEHALLAPLRAGLREVVVVTGAYHDRMSFLARYPVRVVQNSDWASGMSTSLRAGLSALDGSPDAAVICLGDQPFLPPAVIAGLAGAHRRTRAPVVVPVAAGVRRNPVLFDRRLFPLLQSVEGDQGGRAVVARYSDDLVSVAFAEAAWFTDIDTMDDLNA